MLRIPLEPLILSAPEDFTPAVYAPVASSNAGARTTKTSARPRMTALGLTLPSARDDTTLVAFLKAGR